MKQPAPKEQKKPKQAKRRKLIATDDKDWALPHGSPYILRKRPEPCLKIK